MLISSRGWIISSPLSKRYGNIAGLTPSNSHDYMQACYKFPGCPSDRQREVKLEEYFILHAWPLSLHDTLRKVPCTPCIWNLPPGVTASTTTALSTGLPSGPKAICPLTPWIAFEPVIVVKA